MSSIATGSKAGKPSRSTIWDGRGDSLANARFSWIPGHAVDNLDLTCIHFRLLCHIGRQNADRGWLKLSQTELAERWGYKRGSINAAIGQLVKWGLVERLSQKQTGDSFCQYRIKHRPVEEVSPIPETPSELGVSGGRDTGGVSVGDDTDVTSHTRLVSGNRTPQGTASLYASTDVTDKADKSERAQALPAPSPAPQSDAEKAIDLYNRAADEHGFSKCVGRTTPRLVKLARCLREIGGLERFEQALTAIPKDDFLMGRVVRNGQTPFRLNIGHLLQTDGKMGDVLASLLDRASEIHKGGGRSLRPDWWREIGDSARRMPSDWWTRMITKHANGRWPVAYLGPAPEDPGCLVPAEVRTMLKLDEKYPNRTGA